jgi:hypothetical protein
MIVLAYLGSQCTKFYAAGWTDRGLGIDETSVWGRKHEPYMGVWMAFLVQDRLKKARQI